MNFNFKFSIINLIIFLTSILIVYTIYKGFVAIPGKVFYYLKYLFLFIPFLLFNIFLKYKSLNFQKNYIIMLITSIVCIYILEVYLFNWNYSKHNFQIIENKKAAKILGKEFDNRTQYQVIKDMKDKKAVPSMSRTLIDVKGKKIQTLSGIGKRFTILCNEEGSWVSFNSDRYGFNNPDKLWEKKIDIMILGDSSGLGLCVEQEENFSGHIRKKTNYNALQVGGTGMGSLFEYAIYREYLYDKNIENLVMLFLLNDIDNLRESLNNDILKNYLSNKKFSQSLVKKQYLINQQLESHYLSFKENENKKIFKRIIKVFHLRDYVNYILNFKKKKHIYDDFELDNDIFSEILSIYKKIESDFDGNFYIAFYPAPSLYLKMHEEEKTKLEKLRNEVIKKFEFNGFKVIDFHNSLNLKDQPVDKILPFGDLVNVENHYTSFAHELFAEEIIKVIND